MIIFVIFWVVILKKVNIIFAKFPPRSLLLSLLIAWAILGFDTIFDEGIDTIFMVFAGQDIDNSIVVRENCGDFCGEKEVRFTYSLAKFIHF